MVLKRLTKRAYSRRSDRMFQVLLRRVGESCSNCDAGHNSRSVAPDESLFLGKDCLGDANEFSRLNNPAK